MFIQEIRIFNFGSVSACCRTLNRELNICKGPGSDELAAAVGFLSCSLPGVPKSWIRRDTCISAVVSMAREIYTVEAKPCCGRLRLTVTDHRGQDATRAYRYALLHCREQDGAEYFDGQDETVAQRLQWYSDREAGEILSHRTERFAETKLFRKELRGYIQDFRPEPIHCDKDYCAAITPQGEFYVTHPKIRGRIYLSTTEERLFRYICFLNVAEFWENTEQIRDLHHEKKPLMIQNFLEHLDESADVGTLMDRTRKLERQIIILWSARDADKTEIQKG